MKYELTTAKIDGSLLFEFDDDTGQLVQYNLNANLTEGQMAWFEESFPMRMAVFDKWREGGFKFKLEEIVDNPTFDTFYAMYPKKEQKQDAIKAWDKLKEDERRAAVKHLKKYQYTLKSESWRNPLLPASYLNKKMWND